MKTLLLTFSLPLLFLNFTAAADTEDSPLSLTVTLDQETYDWNDDLSAEIVIKNDAMQDTATMHFDDSCYFDLSVLTAGGETVAEEESVCAQVISEVPVTAGNVWTVNETLALDAMAGLPAGEYTLLIENSADVDSEDGNNYSIETQYIPFDLSGPLLIDYSLDQNDYTAAESIELSYTIENGGGEDYSFEAGGCNPYVSFYNAVNDDLVLDEADVTQGCTDDQVTVVVEANGTYTGTKTLSLRTLELEAGVYRLGLSNTKTYSDTFYVLGDGFADITDHWAEEYIQELYLEGVVEGYSTYWFKPDQAITRAEFLKILFEAMQLDMEAELSGSSFADVEEEDWAYLYTENAFDAGIVSGYGDNTFAPSQNITRAEAVSMILSSLGVDLDAIPSRSAMFTDVTVDWQSRYIMEAYVRDIVDGYYNEDNQPNWTFGPNDPLTRAEACKLAVEARK